MGLLDYKAAQVTGLASGIGDASTIADAQEGRPVVAADLEGVWAQGEERGGSHLQGRRESNVRVG